MFCSNIRTNKSLFGLEVKLSNDLYILSLWIPAFYETFKALIFMIFDTKSRTLGYSISIIADFFKATGTSIVYLLKIIFVDLVYHLLLLPFCVLTKFFREEKHHNNVKSEEKFLDTTNMQNLKISEHTNESDEFVPKDTHDIPSSNLVNNAEQSTMSKIIHRICLDDIDSQGDFYFNKHYLPSYYQEDFELDKEKIKNAIKSYAKNMDSEEIILFHLDDTILGLAGDGLIATSKRVYFKMAHEEPVWFNLSEIEYIGLNKYLFIKTIYINDTKYKPTYMEGQYKDDLVGILKTIKEDFS
jgi:hypothetical protein